MPRSKGIERNEENAGRNIQFHIHDCSGRGSDSGRPELEAPQGAYDWMTQATFVATLELEGTPRKVDALRIRFYQVK